MKNTILIIIVVLVWGCGKKKSLADPFSTSKIVNTTNKGVAITIQYDKNEIDQLYGKNSYRLGTLSLENYPQISYDSKNLISKVWLKPKDSLMIEYTKSKKPKFEILKKIRIHSIPKEIIIDTRREMMKTFVQKSDSLYILEIK